MRFSEITNKRFIINAYEIGEVIIDHKRYNNSLIVSPDKIMDHWEPQTSSDIKNEHLEQVIEFSPEILIIGTGKQQLWLNKGLLKQLVTQGINFEMMRTAEACHTYNLLLSEERRVVAALLMITQ